MEDILSRPKNVRNLVFREFYAGDWQPAPHVCLDHCSDIRKLCLPRPRRYLYGFEARSPEEGLQDLRIAQDKWGTDGIRRGAPAEALQKFDFASVCRVAVQIAPDCDGDFAGGAEHTVHFAHGRESICEEHEPELAYHRIKAVVRIRQALRQSLPPIKRRCEFAGDCNHAGVCIDAGDESTGSNQGANGARQNTAPTCNVEHTLVLTNARSISDDGSPVREECRHEESFVCPRAINLSLG